MSPPPIFTALIRTHHITSRKKVASLRKSASAHQVYALLRSGGCPGIMYVEGSEGGVRDWVSAVQRLRYKDFQLVKKPGIVEMEDGGGASNAERQKGNWGRLEEVGSVKEFGGRMAELGVWGWWRRGMGYVGDDG